jgi:hypothetical protein
LMETFIPWGIRSAFCRGEFPRITELTVTSGPYRENISHPLSPQRHLWPLVVWCSILPYKRMQIILTIGQIFCIYLMCLQSVLILSKCMKRYVGINVTHKLRNIAFLFCILVAITWEAPCSLEYCDEHEISWCVVYLNFCVPGSMNWKIS